MNIIPVLICVTLLCLVKATERQNISKPKLLNLVQSENLKATESKRSTSPEERRKLSIFPKSSKKFVVSSETYYNPITHNPIATKQPLMRKNILQLPKLSPMNTPVEIETKQPIINTNILYENELTVQTEPDLVSKEISIEIIEEKSEEILEKQNDDKTFITTADSTNMDYFNVKDFMFPLLKPVEVSSEEKNNERFSDIAYKNKHSEEKVPDLEEYIFLDPVPSPTKDVSSEVSEEFVTTETLLLPNIYRKKRSSNIIVEENLATTMAGYKYTGKDTRQNNDLVFKNIHS